MGPRIGSNMEGGPFTPYPHLLELKYRHEAAWTCVSDSAGANPSSPIEAAGNYPRERGQKSLTLGKPSAASVG